MASRTRSTFQALGARSASGQPPAAFAAECLQIHGGAGYMREYWVERAARDARLGPIGGGSDEIMREILGRVLAL